MERRQAISEALKRTRKMSNGAGKRGLRNHETALRNAHHIGRALKGCCGECMHVQIKLVHRHGNDIAILSCAKGSSPLELFRETPLGIVAECDSNEPYTNGS